MTTGPWIAEDAADAVERDEAGEAVQVAGSGEIWPCGNREDFSEPRKGKNGHEQ